MKLKIFKISLDNVRFDTYRGAVIAAESLDKVEELCKNIISDSICDDFDDFVMIHFPGTDSFSLDSGFFIYSNQNYTISEIGEGEFERPMIIMTSFNAG